ncbi:MAG: hypothetical protein JWQ96_140 [Segetibacter sp.]|nr:hypothetical protein [Segetibacter sp.]
MKKLLIVALLIASVATSAFATDVTKVSGKALQSFSFDYANATNVTWTVKAGVAKASFIENCENVEAFYSHNGDLLGTSKKISLDVLPVSAKRAFAKRYADYTVKEAISFNGVDENAFYISAENNKYSIILKVTPEGTSIFKRTAKI